MMTIDMPPTRVTEAEVAAVCRADETSGPCRRLQAQQADYEAWQRRRAAENAKLRTARMQDLEDARAAQATARAEVVEKELREHLHAQFMRQPAATEADFTRAYPKLREEYLFREAMEAPERERRAQAQTVRYGL